MWSELKIWSKLSWIHWWKSLEAKQAEESLDVELIWCKIYWTEVDAKAELPAKAEKFSAMVEVPASQLNSMVPDWAEVVVLSWLASQAKGAKEATTRKYQRR